MTTREWGIGNRESMRLRRFACPPQGVPAVSIPDSRFPMRGTMAEAMGFFTDTTVCIGCKACEVACKSWNQLPARAGGQPEMSGQSYDNTLRLSGNTWRHVK